MRKPSRWLAPLVAAVALAACARAQRAQDPYGAQVADAVPMIEKATGLRFKTQPRYEIRSKADVHAFLDKAFNEEKSARDIAAQQTVLRRLGIIPDTLDLRKLMLDLLTEQVVGFYDPKTKVLYIVQGSPADQVGFVIQHELVHALQDQYMNLDSIQNVKGEDDRVLAAQAVFEGQATLVPLQAMMGPGVDMPAGWDRIRDMIREQQSSMPVFARTPEFLQEQLIFPYINGMEFMRRFNRERPGEMPYGKDLPASSAQIVHPSEYFASPREMPITITFPAPRSGTLTYDNVMGEFSTKMLIYQMLRDQNQATQAAAGWTGDRYVLVHTPQGDAFAWLMLFETPVDAVEFATAMQHLAATRYNATGTKIPTGMTFSTSGRSVMVWGGAVAGHPAVLYVDVPAGVATNLFDLGKVRVN